MLEQRPIVKKSLYGTGAFAFVFAAAMGGTAVHDQRRLRQRPERPRRSAVLPNRVQRRAAEPTWPSCATARTGNHDASVAADRHAGA